MWEIFLSYPPEVYAAGKFIFSNVVDARRWWIVAAMAVLAILVSVTAGKQTRDWRWWQQGIGASLQTAVVLGVIGLLAGPALQITRLEPGTNNVAVLVDQSGSMAFPDTASNEAGEDASRHQAALDLLDQHLLNALAQLADVALFSFDASAMRVATLPRAVSQGDTHLVSATNSVLASFKGMPLAAVVVLSDGADNEAFAALDAAALASHGVPVHTIGFGPSAMPGEALLTDVYMASEAPPESRVSARLVIEHSSAGEAVIKVRDGTRLLAARRITLSKDVPTVRAEIAFDSGATGIRELTFELAPPAGDNLAENNQIDRLLTVSTRQRRILYLEGEPRWEYKFIRRALARDDVLDLVSWLRTTDRKTYRQGVADEDELHAGFPSDLASLYSFDVIVIGSLAASALSEEQHRWLEAFVAERGGSLLVLAGREALANGRWDAQPLAAALPVYLQRQTTAAYRAVEGFARPTNAGLLSPMTQLIDAEGGTGWASLPQLGDIYQLGELKPAATTLLELVDGEESYPLLVTQPYGLGTTAILATASTWRWQMRTPPDDPRHALFWRQLLRQLAESAQQQRSVKLALDGDGIIIRAWVRDDEYAAAEHVSASALVTHPDRSTATIALNPGKVPGLHTARYVPGAAGVYRIDVNITDATAYTTNTRGGGTAGMLDETVTRFVRAGAERKEYFQPTRNDALLKRMAESTSGRYWPAADVDGLVTSLTFGNTGIRSVEVLPLWHLPLFFLLLILLKIVEWGLRRLWGRV